MSQATQSVTAEEVIDRVRGDNSAYKDADVLRFLYHNASMSLSQIGELFDVSGQTIEYWMQEHRIERRQSQEGYRIRQMQQMEAGSDVTQRIEDLQSFID
jgi:DNA-binding MarR family transcriptional regulator